MFAELGNLVTRARLALSGYYSPDNKRIFVQVTGMADETHQDVELLHMHGRFARPAVGNKTADLIILQVNGRRDHKVAIACEDPANIIPDLQPGEFGDRDPNGQQVVFRQNKIEVTSPNGDVDVTASKGNVNVTATQGSVNITATAATVNINGQSIVLAGGGPAVARVGDTVTCPAGTGHITTGSTKVTAG